MKTLKILNGSKILTSIVVLFMLSWITLLSSCTTTLRTPRHVRSEVVIEGQVQSGHIENDRRHERIMRREKRAHHDND